MLLEHRVGDIVMMLSIKSCRYQILCEVATSSDFDKHK